MEDDINGGNNEEGTVDADEAMQEDKEPQIDKDAGPGNKVMDA